jgi:hypothetical protein
MLTFYQLDPLDSPNENDNIHKHFQMNQSQDNGTKHYCLVATLFVVTEKLLSAKLLFNHVRSRLFTFSN